MRMIILVALSIRTSYSPFPLCSPSCLCRSKGLHTFPATSAVSIAGSVDLGRLCMYIYMCDDRVCIRSGEHADGVGRHIIRGNGWKRAARDAENYPQLSRAHAIHVSMMVTMVTVSPWRILCEFKYGNLASGGLGSMCNSSRSIHTFDLTRCYAMTDNLRECV